MNAILHAMGQVKPIDIQGLPVRVVSSKDIRDGLRFSHDGYIKLDRNGNPFYDDNPEKPPVPRNPKFTEDKLIKRLVEAIDEIPLLKSQIVKKAKMHHIVVNRILPKLIDDGVIKAVSMLNKHNRRQLYDCKVSYDEK